MGNRKMKREIENGKFTFHVLFVCFRFAVYKEEQMVFLDIHALFQKCLLLKIEIRFSLVGMQAP